MSNNMIAQHKALRRPTLLPCKVFSHKNPGLQSELRVQSWNSQPVIVIEDAAKLLLQFRKTATLEIKQKADVNPIVNCLIPTITDQSQNGKSDAKILRSDRLRTVSIDIDYKPKPIKISRPKLLARNVHKIPPSPPGPKVLSGPPLVAESQRESAAPHKPCKKLVGTKSIGPVRDVLQRKFSWKNYPELEQYLIQHRGDYLQYSSCFNYTSEQKRYNNELTQGLLDLASEEGYIFENFTFAAVRDRIRCYYKSCVQAAKKKRKRR